MSVLIKGMKMPKRCDECEFAQDDSWYGLHCTIQTDEDGWLMDVSSIETDRHPDCPIVELPPHGRLIDGDIAEVIVTDEKDEVGGFLDGILYAADWIANQPTIIEAEEVDE